MRSRSLTGTIADLFYKMFDLKIDTSSVYGFRNKQSQAALLLYSKLLGNLNIYLPIDNQNISKYTIYLMFRVSRKEKIIDLLSKKKECGIEELKRYLGISLSTLHRDLNELDREGRIKKSYGEVSLNRVKDIETESIKRLRINVELKKKIGIKALEFLKEGDSIFLDHSTTSYYFAKALSESKFRNILIISNSNLVSSLFYTNKDIEIIVTGGIFWREMECFLGDCVTSNLEKFYADKYIFSAASISLKNGLYDMHEPHIEVIRKIMFKRSREHICLVDSSKFNKIAVRKIFPLEEVDKIITDSGCSKETREEFTSIGKELIIA